MKSICAESSGCKSSVMIITSTKYALHSSLFDVTMPGSCQMLTCEHVVLSKQTVRGLEAFHTTGMVELLVFDGV